MTENKLRKFIGRPRVQPTGTKTHQPVVLSDSKGGKLEKHVTHSTERQLVWWTKGGAKVEDSVSWLERNVARNIRRYGDIWLYVWLGTCNLTTKNKAYISLTSEKDDATDIIVENYHKIVDIVNKYPGSKVTFLETPVYSIKSWNQYQYHKDPSIFEQQDQKLQQQIYTLNNKVREINNTLGTHSPEFTSDLSKTDTYRSGTKRTVKVRRTYTFKLYKDGIHPDPLLAKAWLRKISEQAKRDCWDN